MTSQDRRLLWRAPFEDETLLLDPRTADELGHTSTSGHSLKVVGSNAALATNKTPGRNVISDHIYSLEQLYVGEYGLIIWLRYRGTTCNLGNPVKRQGH